MYLSLFLYLARTLECPFSSTYFLKCSKHSSHIATSVIQDQCKFSIPDGHHIIGEFKVHKPWETIEYDKDGVIVGKIINGVKTIENSIQVTPKLEVDIPN